MAPGFHAILEAKTAVDEKAEDIHPSALKKKTPTPWSLNRLFKGILNSLVDYRRGVFSMDVSQKSLPNTPNSPEHPQNGPLKFPEKVAK